MAKLLKEQVNTVFTKLDSVLNGNNAIKTNLQQANITQQNNNNTNANTYSFPNGVMTAKNQEDWNQKLLQARQTKLFKKEWQHSDRQIMNMSVQENGRFGLYQTFDQMDWYPETSAALDIFMEEATTPNIKGKILNVYSDSKKIKEILEDLFYNRLEIHSNLPMWTRMTCKYGDNFCLLNIDDTYGVLGVKQLPIYEMSRLENGFNVIKSDSDETSRLIFKRSTTNDEYLGFQIAHFRLLTDASTLPYGSSVFLKCIKAWRNLTLAEDSMLVYRLVRAPDRRIYKIFVGNIDPNDVPAYIEGVTNHFKRNQIVDPQTGQIDLKMAIMGVDQDIFMPIRSGDDPSAVETLPGADNMDKIADIELLLSKLVVGLGIPAPFLNFKDVEGGGKNLALQDIRFTRKINRLQQSMLMELNKIAIIHLYLLGYEDEITNFTLSLNSPSNQIKMIQLEEIMKTLTVYNAAVTPPDPTVFPAMSHVRAMKEILGYSEDEIMDNLEEIRIERAAVIELSKTDQIIKKTGFFDKVDKLYGEPGATYTDGDGGDEISSKGGGGMGSSNIDFNAGEPESSSEETTTTNNSGSEVDANTGEPTSPEPSLESIFNLLNKPMLNEKKETKSKTLITSYFDKLIGRIKLEENKVEKRGTKIIDENIKFNSDFNNTLNELKNRNNDKIKDEDDE